MSMLPQQFAEWTTIAFVGGAQHGKSTLVGYTLYAHAQVHEKVLLEAQQAALVRKDPTRKFAYLVDRLPAERNITPKKKGRGFTYENSHWGFVTGTHHRFLFVDCPGHQHRAPNVIAAMTEADALVVVVDIADYLEALASPEAYRRNSQLVVSFVTQLRAYLKIALSFHMTQVIVAVHKMDRVEYAQASFDTACHHLRTMITELGWDLAQVQFIPTAILAAKDEGYNIIEIPPQLATWYQGPTFLDAIKQCHPRPMKQDGVFRMQVQRAFHGRIRGFQLVITGKIHSGQVKVGDHLEIQPHGAEVRIRTIKPIDSDRAVRRQDYWPLQEVAVAGEIVGLGCNVTNILNNASYRSGQLVFHKPSPAIISQAMVVALTMGYMPRMEKIGQQLFAGTCIIGYFETGFTVEAMSRDRGLTWQALNENDGPRLRAETAMSASTSDPLYLKIKLEKNVALDGAIGQSELGRVIFLDYDIYAVFGGTIVDILPP